VGAWDAQRPPAPELIDDCVHCGFCLPTCPSYAVFADEMDSPRGRIVLMDLGHEPGSEVSTEMVTHFDRCLGCMACVTACPSGVRYDRLLEQTRPQLERHGPRSRTELAYRRAIFALFTHPARLRASVPALAAGRATGLLGALAGRFRSARRPVPVRLRALLELAPPVGLGAMVHRLPLRTPARGPRRHGRVALMQGCLQRVFFAEVNEATVRVLAAEGWDVYVPRANRCCGALQLHSGFEPEALELARATIAACEGYDRVAVNVAGCGSAMKDYGELLADDPAWAGRARAFSEKVRDVHELLAEEPPQAVRHPLALRVAYHDACHLAHAQRIREQPRELLRAIPGLELLEPAEWELCCGSAGIYNLTQPEAAAELGRRKAANLLATGAEAIAAANPGCALQLAAHLPAGRMPVHHPMTILDHSLRGATL
jgi:glycolate oxidase iron-sulfur subunit